MTRSGIDRWIFEGALFSPADSSLELDACIDEIASSLDPSVRLLGLGEALHGGEEILQLRNRIFERLVSRHGFSAIAIESSFPRGSLVSDYVQGRGQRSYEKLRDLGFSHGFGHLLANRELVEWMRRYNSDPLHRPKVRFFGFDIPGLEGGIASPSEVLHLVLDYLARMDYAGAHEWLERIDDLLGSDQDWQKPEAMADPEKSIGRSPAANALRIETEDLIDYLLRWRPELVERGGEERYSEALQYAQTARQLLNFHAASARRSDDRNSILLGIRDAFMADCLVHITERERGRGRVLVYAHNSHLQRGLAKLPWAVWWPAGSHLDLMLGKGYAVIGSAIGLSDENGIKAPEPESLEGRLFAAAERVQRERIFIPTHRGEVSEGSGESEEHLSSELSALPVRSCSARNPTYIPLDRQCLKKFDWIAFVKETGYSQGGPSLDRTVGKKEMPDLKNDENNSKK